MRVPPPRAQLQAMASKELSEGRRGERLLRVLHLSAFRPAGHGLFILRDTICVGNL